MFRLITPITYWILIILWSFILCFYIRRMWDSKTKQLFHTLVLILAIDAFRTLFESVYFGIWCTSLSGIIPQQIGTFLTRPELVIIPKIINVIAAVIVIVLLLKRWLPSEEQAQKKLGEALREKEEEFRAFFKNNPVSSWLEDFSRVKNYFDELREKGVSNIETYFNEHPEEVARCAQLVKIKEVNQATLDLHKAKNKEQLLKGLKKTRTPESVEVFKKEMIDVWNGKNQSTYEAIVKTLDNEVRYVTISYRIAPGYEESLANVLVTFFDITNWKLAEDELRKSEAHLRTLVKVIPDLVWLKDKDGIYLSCNQTFERFFGAKEEAIVGKTDYDFVDKELADFFRKHDSMAVAAEKPSINEEWVTFADDGHRALLETIKTPMYDGRGTLIGVLGIGRDITERRKEKTELETAKEEAFAASKAKSEFLANMSHEVRTPMNGIMGMLQLMQMTSLNEEQEEYVRTASISGESLLTIINDILDYAKIESGKVRITPEPFSIISVMDPLIASFKGNLDPEKVTLSYSISSEVPCFLVADRARLRQILFNLIGNAQKFTDSGEISISIEMLPETIGENLRINWIISDTGIGIPEGAGDELFEPFTRVENTNHKRKGTGLGLSIVKQLVVQMGGTVSLKKNVPHGTTVTFNILAKACADDAVTPQHVGIPPVLTSPQRHLSTLVVEDEQINQQILSAILTKLGHKTTVASDGEQALQILTMTNFDVILMDVQMPIMDGMETTRVVRTSEKFAHVKNIPIIALTAYAMAGDRKKCIEAGMDYYLSKPVDVKILDNLLRSLNDTS